jgi:hypothetical protein
MNATLFNFMHQQQALPYEIQLLILRKLDGKAIQKLSQSCKEWNRTIEEPETWKLLVEYRFGKKFDHSKPKEEYLLKDRQSTFLSARELSIAWCSEEADESYWKLRPSEEAKSGYIAVLSYVWWFAVHGNFFGVFPGEYTPTLRIRLNGRFPGRNATPVIHVTSESNEINARYEWEQFKDIFSVEQFCLLRLPKITLSQLTSSLHIQIEETNTQLAKSGFEIDYMALEPYQQP